MAPVDNLVEVAQLRKEFGGLVATDDVDFTTSLRTVGDFWQPASNCIVPMTLISFIDMRPPACMGVAMTPMCTTVSTWAASITFAMIGLRMSARTNSAPPISCRGATTSTPMTRSTAGSCVRIRAIRPPRYRETPVTRTTCPMDGYFLLRRCTRVLRSSLRCFFLAMRLRRFLMTEPM